MNPLGLYDLDRNIRPVGRAYKKPIADWTNLLDAQGIGLTVPLFNPSEQEEPLITREQAKARADRIALGKMALAMLEEPPLPESGRRLPEEIA